MNKELLYSLAKYGVFCGMGFVAGRFTTPAIKTQEKLLEAHSEMKQQTIVQTHANEEKLAEKASETKVVRKYYCPNGNIKEEVRIERGTVSSKQESTRATELDLNLKTTDSVVQSSSKIEYQSRWGIGVFLPVTYPINPIDLNLMLSYHIIGPFSIAAQSDVMFTKPMMGITMQF